MDLGQQFTSFKSVRAGKTNIGQVESHNDDGDMSGGNQSTSTTTAVQDNDDGQLAMDMDGTTTTVKQGQGQCPTSIESCLNVKDEILKYLDGSALINLSCVNKGLREVVTSSNDYKKKINLRVNTKYLDFFNTTIEPLPDWTVNLTHLTLLCNSSQLVFISPEKYLSLARILPGLSTLVVLSDTKPYPYGTTFINKILSLSPHLKSLSIPYPFLLNPMSLHPQMCSNLQELKLTTSAHKFDIYGKKGYNFNVNLNMLITNCIHLKSLACQELINVQGRYMSNSQHYEDGYYIEILKIIENNSEGLEKLEFGISKMLANPGFFSKLAEISMPNLTFLELRAVTVRSEHNSNRMQDGAQGVRDILRNLPNPGQLTALKLTFTAFPFQVFEFIPRKFPQLKSLSLIGAYCNFQTNDDPWSFLQSLTQLEELEIIKLEIKQNNYEFGLKISDTFPDYLQNNNLRKLSLKGADQVQASTFINGIKNMVKLKELTLTESCIYLDDLMSICVNLKALEKLEISDLYCSFNPQSTIHHGVEMEIDYAEILTAISSLKYLKELSIEFGTAVGFTQVLESISFPYLKKLTLVDTYDVGKDQVENIIGVNGMLKELYIENLKGEGDNQQDDFEIVNERNNLQIDIFFS